MLGLKTCRSFQLKPGGSKKHSTSFGCLSATSRGLRRCCSGVFHPDNARCMEFGCGAGASLGRLLLTHDFGATELHKATPFDLDRGLPCCLDLIGFPCILECIGPKLLHLLPGFRMAVLLAYPAYSV
jgi:hypothetical protein